MTMQQPKMLSVWQWRESFFPPEFYVKISTESRLIDTMDVFKLITSSEGAAKVMHSKHLGSNNIENSAKAHGFLVSELKEVFWEGKRGKSKALPIDAMTKVLSVIQTPMALKVHPFIQTVLERTQSSSLVVSTTQNSQADEPPQPAQKTTSVQPSVRTSPQIANQQTAYHAAPQLMNVLPHVAVPNTNALSAEKNALETQKVVAERIAHANEFRRQQEIQDKEHESKKMKLDKEHEISMKNVEENADWKEKLERLDMKFKWATNQGKVQLAEHISNLISDM
jgi:hypothetical protein